MNKKIIALVAGAVMLFSTVTFADYNLIYEWQSEPQTIAKGVTEQTLQKFTDGGWLNIKLLTVALNDQIDLDILTDDYLSQRDKLSSLASQAENPEEIVAAINSDFFDTANNTTMGTLIEDGKVLSTSVGYDEFASFNVTKSGLPFIGYINSPSNTLINESNSKTLKITYINKPYLTYDRSIYFDQTWATMSYGYDGKNNIAEMLVVDGTVQELRFNGGPFTIPANGYVITSVGQNINLMLTYFHEGDKVNMDYDFNLSSIDLAIGGGAQILVNGEIPATFSQNISGKQPRTALGISKDRKTLYLITVDGRTSTYRGATQTELAQILKDLGAYEGINFDGGGSSEMLVKTPWESNLTVKNNPSDGTERKMYTGLAIRKILSNHPTLESIHFAPESDNALLGTGIPLHLTSIDSNYSNLAIPYNDVVWNVSGVQGEITDGIFYPKSAGKANITAVYQGMSAQTSIDVYDNAVSLEISPSAMVLDSGQSKKLTFYVRTEEGKRVTIDPSLVTLGFSDTIGTYDAETQTFTAGDEGKNGYIAASYNDLTAYTTVGIGTEKLLLADFESPTATFKSYPESVTGEYKEVNVPKNGVSSGLLEYDFTGTTETRAAYMVFNQPMVLPTNTESIGLWAFGDYGNSHWLRGKIVDAEGVDYNVTFAEHVNWTGWKYLTAQLPDSMKAPFTFERIYLVETVETKMDKGTLLIDDVAAVVGRDFTVDVPEPINKLKSLDEYDLSEGVVPLYDVRNTSPKAPPVDNNQQADNGETVDVLPPLPSESSIKDWTLLSISTRYYETEKDNHWLVRINNKSETIRGNDYTQWTRLLARMKNLKDKPVIVYMSSPVRFKDALESDLFYKTLRESGVDVTVISPNHAETSTMQMKQGIRFITLNDVDDVVLGINRDKIEFKLHVPDTSVSE